MKYYASKEFEYFLHDCATHTHTHSYTPHSCEFSHNVCVFRLPQPRARDMLDAGVIVALGSDFNPNAYCCSMVSTTPDSCHRGMLHDGNHSPHVSVLSTSLSLSSCTWPVSTWGCPCRRLWPRPPSTLPTPSGAPTHTAPWRSTNMETCSSSTPHGKSRQENMFRCAQRRDVKRCYYHIFSMRWKVISDAV